MHLNSIQVAGEHGLLSILLPGHTDSATVTASGLAVLTTDTKMPGVTKTTVHLHLLHTLKIFTHLALDVVSKKLSVGAIDEILLPVEHPNGDLELLRVLKNSNDLLNLLGLQFTSTNGGVDISLLANQQEKSGTTEQINEQIAEKYLVISKLFRTFVR